MSSPRRPRGRTISATTTRSEIITSRLRLLQDLERKTPVQFGSHCTEQRSNGPRGAPLFSDYFPEVTFCHTELDNGRMFSCDLVHANAIRRVDQRLRDLLNQRLYAVTFVHYHCP